MGMDVYGERPRTNKGEYFRNNVWWWRPLWNYVSVECSDIITKKDIEGGHYNDNYLITDSKAKKIAERLLQLHNDGRPQAIQDKYKEDSKPQSKFNEMCDEAAKYLYDNIVDKKDGKITCPGDMKEHDPDNYERWTTLASMGKIQFIETSYPFDANNIKEFAEFCKDSGGFRIG